MDKIKACPFCGEKPKYKDCGHTYGDEPHHIKCDNEECWAMPSVWGRSKYMATKYWNIRSYD